MRVRSLRGGAGALFAAAFLLPVPASPAAAALPAPIERVSVDDAGLRHPQDHNPNGRVSISADGRYVAFYSYAALTPGASGLNVYVRDRQRGVTELITSGRTPAGVWPGSMPVGMSADGQRVAFASNQTFNPGDPPFGMYVRDRGTGATRLVTPRTSTGERRWPPSSSWVLSSNGRYLAFTTPRFWWDSSPGHMSVYVHDIDADVTTSVYADPGINWHSPSVSDDGRLVGARSNVVHVRDRSTGADVYVGAPESAGGAVSPDGTRLAYVWRAAFNQPTQLMLADLGTGVTSQLTDAGAGQYATGAETHGSWSADSRQFSFVANYPLAEGGWPGVNQVYVYDTTTASFWAAPVLDGVAPDGDSLNTAVANIRTVAFSSTAQNLVPDDGSGVSPFLPSDFGEVSAREDIYVQGPIATTPAHGVVPTPPCPPAARECGPPDRTPRR